MKKCQGPCLIHCYYTSSIILLLIGIYIDIILDVKKYYLNVFKDKIIIILNAKTISIKINKEIYPKIYKLNDKKLEDMIYYLLNIGYQNVFSSVSDKNFYSKMKNICFEFKDDILKGINSKESNYENVNNKLDKFDETINKLFGISKTSNKKGEISENLVSQLIKNKYPNYCYEVKRSIAHNADGKIISPSGMQCLVEIKNYSYIVNNEEVNKFKRDLKSTNNNFGIFISLQTNISGKKTIDFEADENINIIYISNVINDINKLDCAILLIENLYQL